MKTIETLPKILVVDDDNSFRSVLTEELARTFDQVAAAENATRAFELCRQQDYDVILLDIRMPGQDGLEVLKALRETGFDGEVIMLTGHATLDTAISSLKLGAYDYLTKPCKLEELESIVYKAYEKRVLRQQNWTLREVLERQSGYREFIGESPALKSVLELLNKLAATDTTVLITGESGVGKELVARAIHRNSPRKSQPFVVLDCSTLHQELLESELFGHEKGAFTGAANLKRGLFEIADNGTIFLDEVAELSPGVQARLLRVLETGTFRRVGGERDIHVDTRIVAACNQDLEQRVREGKFRHDLYYRLDVVTLLVPPLRERKDDIPRLAQHFIRRGRQGGKPSMVLSDAAIEILYQYAWPGNIRELRNVIERALILCDGQVIEPCHLPENLKSDQCAPLYLIENSLPSLQELEVLYIRNLLKRFGGHRRRVASALGISERSLYRKLHEYGLEETSEQPVG